MTLTLTLILLLTLTLTPILTVFQAEVPLGRMYSTIMGELVPNWNSPMQGRLVDIGLQQAVARCVAAAAACQARHGGGVRELRRAVPVLRCPVPCRAARARARACV